MRTIVITRTHPTLNFGQIVEIQPITGNVKWRALAAFADALPVGEKNIPKNLHRINKHEYWPCDRAHDYEAYNIAVEKAKGWPWQNR